MTEWLFKDIFLLTSSVGFRYKGSAYCSGLLFGVHGGRFLINMAKIITGSDFHKFNYDEDGNLLPFDELPTYNTEFAQ